MFDLGDELIIGSYRIPWLIWIQLLVMFLLIILLFYGFTSITTLDLSAGNGSASLSSTGKICLPNSLQPQISATSSPDNSKRVGRKQSRAAAEAGTSSSREVVRSGGGGGGGGGGGEIQESMDGLGKDATHSSQFSPFQHSFHPCHYLGLAKEAFLKCLGLDSTDKKEKKER